MSGTSQKLASYYSTATAAAVLQAINALVLQLVTHSPSRETHRIIYFSRSASVLRSHVCNAGRDANDVIMRTADDTGRIYGAWRHVATGCNTLVYVTLQLKMNVRVLKTRLLASFVYRSEPYRGMDASL